MLQVVAGQRTEGRGKGRAALIAELFGMQLHRQAQRARCLEHTPRLRRREGDVFAEGIDRIDQAFGMQLRQPGAHRGDVVVGAAVEFRRQRVRRQAGGPHRQRQLGTQAACDAQAAGFVFEAQAITRLDLQRAHAFGHQRECALAS